MKTALVYSAAVGSVLLLAWLVVDKQTLAFAILGGVALMVLLWCVRHSATRIALVSAVLLISVPVVPGLQEARTPQMVAFLVATVPAFAVSLRLARSRGRSIRLPVSTFLILGTLTTVTVGLWHPNQFRLAAGFVIASTLALAISVGISAGDLEMQRIFAGLTIVAVITSSVAIIEVLRGAPLYVFTTFQVPSNSLTAFRASAVYGHPLVLCTFSAYVAIANMARPRAPKTRWYNSRIFTVSIPMAGAIASGSRTLVLVTAVALFAIVVSRRSELTRGANKALAVSVAIVTLCVAGLGIASNSTLGSRLGSLSLSDESVRLNGLNVVTSITTGIAQIIGGGPKSVSMAFDAGLGGARLGTVDNQFLTSYADFGLVGVALVAVLALILVSSVRKRGISPWQITACLASLVPLTAFLAFDVLGWPITAFALGIGVGAALRRTSSGPEPWTRLETESVGAGSAVKASQTGAKFPSLDANTPASKRPSSSQGVTTAVELRLR